MDSINGISYYLNKCQSLSSTSHMTSFSFRKTAHWCTCIVCATQSNFCGALDFLSPNSPELNAFITTLRESYSSVRMSRQSKRLKKLRSGWLNSGNALIQHLSEKKRFSCFSVLPCSVETQVIWGGRVKRLLVVYFIRNISSKNIKMHSRLSKL